MSDEATDARNGDVNGSASPASPSRNERSATAALPDPDQVLSLTQAAAYLQVSRLRVLSAIRAGRLPAAREGLGYRIALTDLLRYADATGGETTPSLVEAIVSPRNPADAAVVDADVMVGSPTELLERVQMAIIELYDRLHSETPRGKTDSEVLAEPVKRMVTLMIAFAIQNRASDIHIEPDRMRTRLRVRIDGNMTEIMQLPLFCTHYVTNYLKALANLPLDLRGGPHRGVVRMRYDDADYILRVTAVPAHHGNAVTIHVLRRNEALRGQSSLGFTPEVQAVLEELLIANSGLVLITGPAGSGKTTTLFSCLHKTNSVKTTIYTLEDPVEYTLGGIQQVGAAPFPGRDIASLLPTILCQDTDIVAIDQIDDAATAQAVVRAIDSGCMILATMNAPDAVGAIRRLYTLGVDSEALSQGLVGVLSQRLVPTICPNCRTAETVSSERLRGFGYRPEDTMETVTLSHGTGCDACKKTGVFGRTGLFELLTVNEEIRDLIAARAPASELREAAVANGLTDLKRLAGYTVREGKVSLDDASRLVTDLWARW